MAASLGCRLFFTLRVLVLSLLASCAQKTRGASSHLAFVMAEFGDVRLVIASRGSGVGCAGCAYIDVSWREVRRTVNAAPIC